jgi:hypothetical protein
MDRSAEPRISARTRADIVARLERRLPEMEEVILTRTSAVSGAELEGDAEYRHGLRGAIEASVGFGLAALERGEERCGEPPAAVGAQARLASRRRVGLQVVLCRYAAGYSALSDFLMQEMSVEDSGVSPAELYQLQRELTVIFDRLVNEVSSVYEEESRHTPPSERRARRLRRLLAGELVDTTDLDYDLDAWHLGAVATGPGGARLLREAASDLDRRLLILSGATDETVYGWFGGPREFEPRRLEGLAGVAGPGRALLAIGAPAQGLRGWRVTHRQALAAMSVAVRRPRPLTRYPDVALLAAVLADQDLVEFLTQTYLAPLTTERDGGEVLRRTLRAYFAASRNVSSTAAALGVSRKTVDNRLRMIEARLGSHVAASAVDFEVGLALDQLVAAA